MDLLISVLLFLGALLYCLLRGRSLAWALALAAGALFVCGLRWGKPPRALLAMIRREIPGVLIVVRILCYVGLLTGLWRSSGTIPFFIVWGIRTVPPRLFLLLAYLLTLLLSYAIGTSFGVSSTAGVMLMALARAGGVSVPITAGVILSGVYFGDRGSPSSSCASLLAAVTKTDHYRNVRALLKSALAPLALTLAVYTLLSLRNPLQQVDAGLLSALETGFRDHWLALLPAAVMLLLPLTKLPIRLCMGVSALCALVLTMTVQGASLPAALSAAVMGYRPEGALKAVLSGGGLLSMVPTMLLLLFAGACTGLIDGLHLLDSVQTRLAALCGKLGRFPAACLTGVAAVMVFCNQTIALMFCNQLLAPVYDAEGASREELALDLSASVVVLCGLVPWAISCSVPLTMLGADTAALPYACFLYLLPLCRFLGKRFFPGRSPARPLSQKQSES